MSEFSRTPNIFPVLVMPSSPLGSKYYKDVPKHQNEDSDHSLEPQALLVAQPPFSLFEYL